MSDRSERTKLLVIGAAYEDLFLSVERDAAWGESLAGNGYASCFGGKSANQAVAASRLGANVTFLGVVGNDERGKRILANLEREGVDIAGVRTVDGAASGFAVVIVDADGRNKNFVFKEATEQIKKQDVDRMLQHPFDAVMTSFEVKQDILSYILHRARGKGLPVFLDAGPIVPCDLEKLRGAAVLSPNESEAEALCGIRIRDTQDAKKAALRLKELSGAGIVLLKLGSGGAYLLNGAVERHFPAMQVDVKDTTGAGDAFDAAFMVRYCREKDLPQAVEYANAMAALCVGKEGSQPSFPYENNVNPV